MYYMFIAEGFEETEALVTLDMMRRAHIDVRTVGVDSVRITGTHGIIIETDISEEDISTQGCDGIILPGGMPGTENLFSSEAVHRLLKYCYENGKMISAICAAPVIPGRVDMLQEKKAVCYPGFENELKGSIISDELCVRDGNIITAKGAGAVFEFSFEIISYICGKETACSVLSAVQHKGI